MEECLPAACRMRFLAYVWHVLLYVAVAVDETGRQAVQNGGVSGSLTRGLFQSQPVAIAVVLMPHLFQSPIRYYFTSNPITNEVLEKTAASKRYREDRAALVLRIFSCGEKLLRVYYLPEIFPEAPARRKLKAAAGAVPR